MTVDGEVDLTTAPTLRAQLRDCIDRNALPLVVDLRSVTFCDSQGLNVLVSMKRLASAMRIVMTSDQRIFVVFRICGLDRTMRIFPDVDRALLP